MTETGTAADLAAMKIPELRKLAAEKGLKGISGLRKGELIQAIVTGQVPRKAAAEKAAPVVAVEYTSAAAVFSGSSGHG